MVVVIVGVINKNPIQNILFIIGGICLEIYSIFIGDLTFIVLEAVFTISAVYDLIKTKRK